MNIETLHKLFLSCSSATTDSRNCPENSMFFALTGESFNGNRYAGEAIKKGSKYAVVDDRSLSYPPENIILVDDVLKTLQELASYHRDFLSIPILAITGTNGKTTTKELTREVLKQKFNVKATEGNYNNHIGVPLTLLSFSEETEFGIVEMGANHPGEIELLCNIAKPDFGLITNIGKAHLEGFGSVLGIMKTKGELYDYLSQNAGTIFSNKDNNLLMQILPRNAETVFYGISNKEGLISGQANKGGFFLNLTWRNNLTGKEYVADTRMIGDYNLENVLAAITVGSFFNIPDELINKAITKYIPSNNRSQYLKTGKNEVLLDAYNANPSSMQKALENFENIGGDKKALILGGMKELGEYSEDEHSSLLKKVRSMDVKKIILVGTEFKSHLKTIPEAEYFNTVDELIDHLKKHPVQGYKILIKGSRGIKLEKTINLL